jgi:hypothetical protein
VKKALRRRYGWKSPTYYRYYVRVGGSLLRDTDGSKIWFSTPGAARARARRLGGKVETFSHDRRPK